ncbi:endonuclease domain-containing protein [Sphingobium sp. Cam5-1]|uniref:endonuclease domain-containing protein n=1 Tax=Sphingobium sp. Cam5-1 TaxID=2789327 RepID=UPI003FA6AE38
MSPPEVALWQWLRQRPDGLKFRRQHPTGPYVLDFYCASVGLAVEVDGSGHDNVQQIAHDERRDVWLRAQGIEVLRIKATDVLRNLENVTSHILHHCRAFPLHHASHGPPPHAEHGEEL